MKEHQMAKSLTMQEVISRVLIASPGFNEQILSRRIAAAISEWLGDHPTQVIRTIEDVIVDDYGDRKVINKRVRNRYFPATQEEKG